jgi:hypothetical protein
MMGQKGAVEEAHGLQKVKGGIGTEHSKGKETGKSMGKENGGSCFCAFPMRVQAGGPSDFASRFRLSTPFHFQIRHSAAITLLFASHTQLLLHLHFALGGPSSTRKRRIPNLIQYDTIIVRLHVDVQSVARVFRFRSRFRYGHTTSQYILHASTSASFAQCAFHSMRSPLRE